MNYAFVFVIVTILSVLFVYSFLISPASGLSSVDIFQPGDKPYGLTYPEHIESFWKYILGTPASQNPINDPTGAKCATGQSNTNSSVFYLAFNNGGSSERTCKVPAGNGLFIPVMQVEWSDKEAPGASIQQLNASAKKDQDNVNSLYLKIGDKEYKYADLIKYRTHTKAFNVVFPDNAIFDVRKGGVAKDVADGFYVITKPFAKGNYTLHFKSSLLCKDVGCETPSFAQDIKYNIIAQ
jgi:hypothetical protein